MWFNFKWGNNECIGLKVGGFINIKYVLKILNK